MAEASVIYLSMFTIYLFLCVCPGFILFSLLNNGFSPHCTSTGKFKENYYSLRPIPDIFIQLVCRHYFFPKEHTRLRITDLHSLLLKIVYILSNFIITPTSYFLHLQVNISKSLLNISTQHVQK